jgi:hypothetical protein
MTRDELRVLADLVHFCCSTETRNDGVVFVGSSAIPARAAAIRLLARYGLMEIGSDVGRNVRARWTDVATEIRSGADGAQPSHSN